MNRKIKVAVSLALCLSLLSGCNSADPQIEPADDNTSAAEQTSAPAPSESEESSDAPTDSPDTDSSSESSAGATSENTTEPAQTGTPLTGVDGVMTNGLLKMTDSEGHVWGISLYGGGTGDSYAASLNEFKKAVGDTVNVYNMVIPTQGEFYLPEKFSNMNASQLNSINNIANQLDGVINIDGYGALKAHTNEYIYTRTDHHWEPLGAYYAAKAFCETAQVEIKDLSTYTEHVVEGFVGSMYTFSNYDPDIKNDPDVFTYYVPSTDHVATYYTTEFVEDYDSRYIDSIFIWDQPVNDSYTIFMGGDQKIVKAVTDNKNGRKLCVFKDSYGNAEIPFFIDAFEEIYVCDVRYFDNLYGPDFVKDNGITDVLFTMCTFSAVGENAETMRENLLTKR